MENMDHMGPVLTETGVNFAAYSENATRLEVLRLDDAETTSQRAPHEKARHETGTKDTTHAAAENAQRHKTSPLANEYSEIVELLQQTDAAPVAAGAVADGARGAGGAISSKSASS